MNSLKALGLTRLFHTDSAAACEHLMDTASASNCSSGSMKHTAVVAIHHLPCLHQDSRRFATNQYEISGLTCFARGLNFKSLFSNLIIILITCVSLVGQEKETVENMRHARYGEIIVVTGGPFVLTGHVYNTIGFSDCSDELWKGLNVQQLKKEQLKSSLQNLQQQEISIAKELEDKYGQGSISLETGEFLPSN